MSFQTYTPYVVNIASVVSNGLLTTITFDVPHGFVVGSLVAYQVPKEYGMRQLNGLKTYVFDYDANSIIVVLDSSQFDPFVIPTFDPSVVLDPAQAIPAGDANSGTSAPDGVLESLTIPGAYQAVVN